MKWLKRLILAIFLLDNLLMRSIKRFFPRSWRLSGKCKQCGQCCQDICMLIHPIFFKAKYPLKIIVAWISWLFDFNLKGIEMERHFLVFSCRHISENGKCTNYFWRSHICRNYPIIEYFEEPVTRPNCGYQVVKNK